MLLASIAHVELEWELFGTHQFRSVIQSSEAKGSFKGNYRRPECKPGPWLVSTGHSRLKVESTGRVEKADCVHMSDLGDQ